MNREIGRRSIWIMAVALVMVLSGCAQTVDMTPIITPEPTETPIPTPTPQPRSGAYLDHISMTEIDEELGIGSLANDSLDIYAGCIDDPKDVDALKQGDLALSTMANLEYEITLNTVDTRRTAKRLNPFYSKSIREALNYLIDREFISQELFLGNAISKAQPIGTNCADYARYLQYIRQVDRKYGYSKEEAQRIIHSEMDRFGAVINEEGKWSYNSREVTLKFVIRNDDVRLSIGHYIADELESAGFAVDRIESTESEAFRLWATSLPEDGKWHLYTNAWMVDGTERDSSSVFLEEYTDQGSKPYRPYKYYEADEDFTEIAKRLAEGDYTSLEEREELFGQAILSCNKESSRIWIAEGLGVVPMQTTVENIGAVAKHAEVTPCLPYLLRFEDEGGILRWGSQSLLTQPVNAVGGSNAVAEQQVMMFTQDHALMKDPHNGLSMPQHVKHAELHLTNGALVEQTMDWVDVKTVNEIPVPNDVWVNWDAENQNFILGDQDYLERLVDEAYENLEKVKQKRKVKDWEIEEAEDLFYQAKTVAKQGYMTANRKVIVTYDEDLIDLKWHDGTHVSVADFVMSMIIQFELSDESSALYLGDERYNNWREGFKGYKIISEDPLVIESYYDDIKIDVESNIEPIWPSYGKGQAPWYLIALSNMTVVDGKLAYSKNAATGGEGALWMDWVQGESLDTLKAQATIAHSQGYIPYPNILRAYINDQSAKDAYESLMNFYEEHGHFAVGLGPYFIDSVEEDDGGHKQIKISKFEDYILKLEKWEYLSEPKILNLKLDGPKSIKKGEENKFNAYATYGDEGMVYLHEDLRSLTFMLYDEHGLLVHSQHMEAPMADGVYSFIIDDAMIDAINGAYGTLEVVGIPKTVSVPAWDSLRLDIE